MLLSLAGQRRLLFFGGKGGVGKTTLAAATALAAAMDGRRVLLVSTDPAHNLGHLWGRDIGPEPVCLHPGLDALELDPERTARAHLDSVGDALRKLMPAHLRGEIDKHMQLSRDAPGLHEAALLERIAELSERAGQDYELVIFDTAPSGHTARLMALPETMAAWTQGLLRRRDRAEGFADALRNLGRDDRIGDKVLGDDEPDRDSRIRHLLLQRQQRFQNLRQALADPHRTGFIIVLIAERLPVLETIELQAQLAEAGVAVAALAVNRRSPADAGSFLAERRKHEDAHMVSLRRALPSLPCIELPLLPEEPVGQQALARLAAQLR